MIFINFFNTSCMMTDIEWRNCLLVAAEWNLSEFCQGTLVKHLLNSCYFILNMVSLTLPIISRSKNKINRKCIVEAIKVLNSKYANTLYLNRRARDGHNQKLIKGGVHQVISLPCKEAQIGHSIKP